MAPSTRISVDVGGTFTDVVKLDPTTGALRFEKVPTTPRDPKRGVLDAFAKAEAPLEEVASFNHGTTLGLNSLLTRTGARVAIIGTRGFRDVYLLGRTDRRAMYDITYRKPAPLVRRRDTFEVTERTLYDGSIKTPLDLADAERVAHAIAEGGYDAVAVGFLHSYANPENEITMGEVLAQIAPSVEVTLSHELSREYREYERTSTAVLDAYIKPIVRRYLRELSDELTDGNFDGRFLMSRSGGGAMTAQAAAEQPVNLILSGPAGGVVGAAALSRELGEPNIITIDMGGTSLDASLVLDHEPVMYQGAEFEGLPINTPSLYIHTIGAGGGSIISLDEAGALQVGPQSAGADPGPAAYARGGSEPTFTDAAVTLGYMGADLALGGDLALDEKLATEALTPIAERLDMSIEELARGAVQIANMKIVGAVRAITVELGRDPQDFALMSFGGGGGLVAVDVARELNIPRVIVPPGQGAFSALGMLMADVQHDFARTSVRPLRAVDPAFFADAFGAMEGEAAEALEREGFGPQHRSYQRTVDVRYAGQEHSATVVYPEDAADVIAAIEEEFAVLHRRLYGHTMTDPVEITTLRLKATGVVEKPSWPRMAQRSEGAPEPISHRNVHATGVPSEYRVFSRESLLAGDEIAGPAIIAEHTATTVMHEGDRLVVGPLGELVIHVKAEGENR
ncbi:hydantoinase/oxoprolinase family protein [uncultured Aeromicrobium sp.]|uniref:hydantoinase/oxoprolinase family protein n=1 Tax=uncultured Aeromicrobium sp. TaxID=337820 RepID=UPI0025E92224|nr:hydantoinase/oxoprolinase family protein [uncultured Aeromicrobium sp.]